MFVKSFKSSNVHLIIVSVLVNWWSQLRLSSQANRPGGNQSNLSNPSNLPDWTHDDNGEDRDRDDYDHDDDDVDEDDDDEGNFPNLENWTHPSERQLKGNRKFSLSL